MMGKLNATRNRCVFIVCYLLWEITLDYTYKKGKLGQSLLMSGIPDLVLLVYGGFRSSMGGHF